MKHLKLLFTIALLLLLCQSLTVSAHPGRTDSNGGHNSPSGYHYHHGYPAHDHENGICPYDFHNNEKENYNYGSSSIDDDDDEDEEYTYQSTTAVEPDKEEQEEKMPFFKAVFIALLITIFPFSFIITLTIMIFETIKEKFFKYSDYYSTAIGIVTFVAEWICILFFFLGLPAIGLIAFFSILLITFIVWYIISKKSNDKGYKEYLKEEQKKEEQKRLEEAERQRKIAERKRIFNQEREKYLIYENKTKTEIFNIYFKTNINIAFDDKNLPVPIKKQYKFGEYTVYCSSTGKKFHYKKGCSGASIPNSIFKISRRHYTECEKCKEHKKEIPITHYQYSNFLTLLSNLEYYNIHIKDYDAK